MEQLEEQQRRAETQKYMRRLVQIGLVMLLISVFLNIASALYSHIALWQVLLWLCFSCLIVSCLCFATHVWVGRNNL